IGSVKLKIHENNATPILQLTSQRKIAPSSWIRFKGVRLSDDDKLTICKHEFVAKWKNLDPMDNDKVARPLLMGYDIEVNSTIPSSMPKSSRPGDCIFQISCVFKRQ